MFIVRLLGPLDFVLFEGETLSSDIAIIIGEALEAKHSGKVEIVDFDGMSTSLEDFKEERRV